MIKYEDVPRPNTEHHYHIRELIEGQEKRVQDRNYHRNREKDKEERNSLIKDSKPHDTKEFYCDRCKLDFLAQTIKEIEQDWNNPTEYIAFYKTKCFKGHWCTRLITDRHKDPYWFRSRRVAKDKGEHALDIIQPWETNYQLLYGRKNTQ